MQGVFPVLCFIAGFALAWFVLRGRRQEVAAAIQTLSADALARNAQAIAWVVAPGQASLDKINNRRRVGNRLATLVGKLPQSAQSPIQYRFVLGRSRPKKAAAAGIGCPTRFARRNTE